MHPLLSAPIDVPAHPGGLAWTSDAGIDGGTPVAALGFGLPGERLAQRAAQRSFHVLKRCFEEAAASLEGRRGAWLQAQVQAAQEPIDLWLLRGALTSALVAAEGVAMSGLMPEPFPEPAPGPAGERSDEPVRGTLASPTEGVSRPAGSAIGGGRLRRLAQVRQRLERTLGEVFADRLDWPAADFSARAGLLQA